MKARREELKRKLDEELEVHKPETRSELLVEPLSSSDRGDRRQAER